MLLKFSSNSGSIFEEKQKAACCSHKGPLATKKDNIGFGSCLVAKGPLLDERKAGLFTDI